MTKKLRKEVITKSSLLNRYNKNRTYENWLNYKKQRMHQHSEEKKN